MDLKQEKSGKTPLFLLIGMFAVWGCTLFLWWYNSHSAYVNRVTLVAPDGSMIEPSSDSKIVVPYQSLSALGGNLGVSVHFNESTNSVMMSELEAPAGVEADVSLRPVAYDPSYYIRERDLYGEWIGTAENGQVFGFSFMGTDDYGPYTVLEVWGVRIDENGDTHDVSRMGFYEVLDDNRVRMIFKTRLAQDTQEVDDILEIDFWDVSADSTFITLSKGDVSVRMSRIETNE